MQGKRIILAALGGLAALSFATSASAVMSSPFGWYLEANGGSAKLSNKSYPGSSSSSGIGGNANVGYKFMPYFATEIGYSQYPNTSIKNSVGTKAGSDKHYSYDLAAKGILPIAASGAEAFAKLGLSHLATSMSISNAAAASAIGLSNTSHSATGLYMAVGAQYYFMPELAVVAQWARAQGNNSTGNEELLSGGVSFIFN
jgi:hypothetical protein